MREIALNSGLTALVDDDSYEDIVQFKWYASGLKTSGPRYALRIRQQSKYERITESMHRRIMAAEKGEIIDHINGNGLDNRRGNLRRVTSQQNSWNVVRGTGLSGIRGIIWIGRRNPNKPWHVQIKIHGKIYSGGNFVSKEEAKKTRMKMELELFGEFSRYSTQADPIQNY